MDEISIGSCDRCGKSQSSSQGTSHPEDSLCSIYSKSNALCSTEGY